MKRLGMVGMSCHGNGDGLRGQGKQRSLRHWNCARGATDGISATATANGGGDPGRAAGRGSRGGKAARQATANGQATRSDAMCSIRMAKVRSRSLIVRRCALPTSNSSGRNSNRSGYRDQERWMATPASSGDPRDPAPHIALKPQAPGSKPT